GRGPSSTLAFRLSNEALTKRFAPNGWKRSLGPCRHAPSEPPPPGQAPRDRPRDRLYPLRGAGYDGGVSPPVIGPYRIECTLGRGGAGTVYRAQDDRTNEEVAIKVLRTT